LAKREDPVAELHLGYSVKSLLPKQKEVETKDLLA
jgi:hypothetical protein